MSTAISDIRSTNWQISTAGFGVIAEGLDDIKQCIDILLRTEKGADPLRPEFGSDIYQYVDAPVNVAVPNIKRCIIEATGIWEKRVTIQNIVYAIDGSNIFFDVTYKLVNQDIIDSLLVFMDGTPGSEDTAGSSLIFTGYYPVNTNGRNYFLTLVFDNMPVNPEVPANGFSTLNELFAWAQNNLTWAGRWVQLTDRIIFYVNPGVATTGSLSIDLLSGTIILRSFLPFLDVGQTYHVQLNFPPVNGVSSVTLSDNLNSKDDLLSFLKNSFPQYGTWSIEAGSVNILGDFDMSVFNTTDFESGSQAGYYLILNSTTLPEGNLIITVNG